jgi:hypothetical protein
MLIDSPIRVLAALLTAVALAACTTPDATTGHADHADQARGTAMQAGSGMAGGQSGAGMAGGTSSGQMKPEGMDMSQMCAMHRNMQSMPMEQRQAMMDQQMKGMSPEMRQQHMEMMRQQCK